MLAAADKGDPYFMPSIAAAVIGGTLMFGGRVHYLGMFGGALLLTALSILLSGLLMRGIVFGAVILAAVIAFRDRNLG